MDHLQDTFFVNIALTHRTSTTVPAKNCDDDSPCPAINHGILPYVFRREFFPKTFLLSAEVYCFCLRYLSLLVLEER